MDAPVFNGIVPVCGDVLPADFPKEHPGKNKKKRGGEGLGSTTKTAAIGPLALTSPLTNTRK